MIEGVKIVIFFCLIELVLVQSDILRVRKREDAKGAEFYALDMIGLVEERGYPIEEHNVTTDDGYILNIFRVPWSPKKPNNTENKPVVLLMSGLAGSSDAWVVLGSDRSLSLQLADAGYDVWMGNYRGNSYGRAHINLSPNDPKFWDFSQQELGVYDVANSIDYILNITKQPTLTYIGHSLGGTVSLILLSERPEYNDKINFLITFSPVSNWIEQSLFRSMSSALSSLVQHTMDPYGTTEVFRQSSLFAQIFKKICKPNGLFDFCYLLFDISFGEDHSQVDKDKIELYTCHFPSGSASKVFYHYFQAMKSGVFRQWDYENPDLNMKHYGQLEPPAYNLSNIRTPMILYYGKNDPLLDVVDVRSLINSVSSKVIAEPIRHKDFNHIDFVIAKDVKTLVNDRVIERLEQFYKGELPYLQSENSIY